MIKGFKKHREKLRKHFQEIITIKDSPQAIALGFTIGTAIAVLPTFGFGPLIGLFMILIFKKISKVSLFASFIVWNPIILALLIPLEYWVGDFLLGRGQIISNSLWFLDIFANYSKRYLLGNIIVTVIASSLSYAVIYALADKHQDKYKRLIEKPLQEAIETFEEKIVKVDEKIKEKVEDAHEKVQEIGEKLIEKG